MYSVNRLFPQAFLLVHFLESNNDNTYRRMLFEGIELLKKGEPADSAFFNYAEQWIGLHNADDAFSIYTSTIRTAKDLLSDGITYYTQAEYGHAAAQFMQILAKDDKNSTAQYYLALIAYETKDYITANDWYLQALKNGGNEALIHWALAISSFAAEDYENAQRYAEKAQTLAPNTYTERSETLIKSAQLRIKNANTHLEEVMQKE